MISDHTERYPSAKRCREVIEEFAQEKEHSDSVRDIDRTMIVVRIPFVIRSERITLDQDKIDRMDLFCPYEEKWREFSDETIKRFKWGGSYSASTMAEDPEWENELYRTQIIDNIARDVHNICRDGFMTREVYGTREEYVEESVPLGVIDNDDMGALDIPETRERRYPVGTRRHGIGGVVTDGFWWVTSLEAARSEHVL